MKNYRPGYSPKKRGYVPAPAPDNVRPPRGRSGAVKEKTSPVDRIRLYTWNGKKFIKHYLDNKS